MILMREGSVFSWWQSAAIFDFYGTKGVSDGQKEGGGGAEGEAINIFAFPCHLSHCLL